MRVCTCAYVRVCACIHCSHLGEGSCYTSFNAQDSAPTLHSGVLSSPDATKATSI